MSVDIKASDMPGLAAMLDGYIGHTGTAIAMICALLLLGAAAAAGIRILWNRGSTAKAEQSAKIWKSKFEYQDILRGLFQKRLEDFISAGDIRIIELRALRSFDPDTMKRIEADEKLSVPVEPTKAPEQWGVLLPPELLMRVTTLGATTSGHFTGVMLRTDGTYESFGTSTLHQILKSEPPINKEKPEPTMRIDAVVRHITGRPELPKPSDSENLDVFHACNDIREKALLGAVAVFGGLNWRTTRPADYDQMVRAPIPAEYWRDRQIDVIDLLQDGRGRTCDRTGLCGADDYYGLWFDEREVSRIWPTK